MVSSNYIKLFGRFFLEIEEKGEEAEQRVFKSRLERNKYTDFTFKFLSRLDMQNYQMNLPDFY